MAGPERNDGGGVDDGTATDEEGWGDAAMADATGTDDAGADAAGADATGTDATRTDATRTDVARTGATGADATVAVVGCGDAGGRVVTRLFEGGADRAELVAANTDARRLQATRADVTLRLGTGQSRASGGEVDPAVGRDAAHESLADVEDAVGDRDLVVVAAGLGGATGTGAAPVVAECASKHGALTVAVVTLPFAAESQHRTDAAAAGLDRLDRFADAVLVVPSDRILDYAPELSLDRAFELCDDVLVTAVTGLLVLVGDTGLVTADLAAVGNVLGDGGRSLLGVGEGTGEGRCRDAATAALRSPLLDGDVGAADGALVHVAGGPSLTVDGAEAVVDRVTAATDPPSGVVWGAAVDPALDDALTATVVLTDVGDPATVRGRDASARSDDIDFVE